MNSAYSFLAKAKANGIEKTVKANVHMLCGAGTSGLTFSSSVLPTIGRNAEAETGAEIDSHFEVVLREYASSFSAEQLNHIGDILRLAKTKYHDKFISAVRLYKFFIDRIKQRKPFNPWLSYEEQFRLFLIDLEENLSIVQIVQLSYKDLVEQFAAKMSKNCSVKNRNICRCLCGEH